MDISGGLLGNELRRVASKDKSTRKKYTSTILAGGKEIQALSVTRVDIGSNFEKKYRDDITVTLLLPLGTLINEIAPYQDDLTIRLRVSTVGSYEMDELSYKAYLMEDMPNDVEVSTDPGFRDPENANRLSNVNVSFGLTLSLVEYLDAIRTGFVSRMDPPFAVLKVLFKRYMDAINFTVDEGIRSISMVEASNLQPRPQIVIPDNTRLVDLPDILQDKMGGIYSSGLGFYLMERDLYFWPLYDMNRNEASVPRLHIIMPVTIHASILDNTYDTIGNLVTIIASGKPKVIDDTLGQTYREGDSIRYQDGNVAFEPLGDAKGGVITADRQKRHIETNAVTTGKKIQTVSGGSQVITSNIYREMSKKAELNGIRVMIEWRYSDHYLIKPGMQTTLFMESRGDVKEIPGVVIAIHSKLELESEGVASQVLVGSSVITVFINREDWRMADFKSSGMQSNINTVK